MDISCFSLSSLPPPRFSCPLFIRWWLDQRFKSNRRSELRPKKRPASCRRSSVNVSIRRGSISAEHSASAGPSRGSARCTSTCCAFSDALSSCFRRVVRLGTVHTRATLFPRFDTVVRCSGIHKFAERYTVLRGDLVSRAREDRFRYMAHRVEQSTRPCRKLR